MDEYAWTIENQRLKARNMHLREQLRDAQANLVMTSVTVASMLRVVNAAQAVVESNIQVSDDDETFAPMLELIKALGELEESFETKNTQ